MSSGESGESLASRLADAEAALLFARVNEKRLSEENSRYRERCEELSTQLLEAATPAAPVATAKPPRAPDASAQADHEDRVLNLFLTDGKNLSERKVPGLVGAPNGALEFGTVSATVSGAEFVGLRPLRARRDEASAKPAPQPQRWMSERISDMLSRGNDEEPADVGGSDGDSGADGGTRRRSGSVASDASGDASSSRDSDCESDAAEDAEAFDAETHVTKPNAALKTLKTYEIMWKEGGGAGPLRRLAFEANKSGLAYVKKRVQAWSLEARQGGDAPISRAARDAEEASIREEMRRASLSPRLDAVENRGEKKLSTSKTKPTALPLGPHAARLSEPSAIFSEDVARRLTSALPARLRLRDWKMAYSSKRDGISLRSLYRAAAREASAKNGSSAESLLFVRDSRGNAFGAFATEPWRVHQRYYGTGESFVFTVEDESSSRTSATSEKELLDDANEKNPSGVFAFRWSQRNDYFMFGRADCAAVGGGNGFALWLDEELLRGNSASSETFDNPCLSGGVKDFEIVYVELWTFAARNA